MMVDLTIVDMKSIVAMIVSKSTILASTISGKETGMSTEMIDKQQIPAGDWGVDPVHSSTTFAVTHNGVTTFRSGFERYEARLAGGEQPRLEGTVEVESIAIEEEMLKGHLLSPEFFDTQRFP